MSHTAAEIWALEQIQQFRLSETRARLRYIKLALFCVNSSVELEAACRNPIMLSPTARIVFPLIASQTPQTS